MIYNIHRLNTQGKDTAVGSYFTQSQNSIIRRVLETNMNEFSFHPLFDDRQILETIRSKNQALFDTDFDILNKFGCKVRSNFSIHIV